MQKKRSKIIGSPRKIVFVLLTLLLFFAFTEKVTAAVTGKIAGTVRDISTGEPLPLANCIIEGTELGAACDMEGDYFIINIPPGTYSVTVRMMGYETITKTDIDVDVGHTTDVDFELRSVAVEVPGIEVVARREVVKMDVSSSEIVSSVEQIKNVPLVTDIREYMNLQAGIENDLIRGGGIGEIELMLDGMILVDNRSNKTLDWMVNLSAMKELNIIKGGFNAEYGNVRSGLINVVTKEGSPNEYHGTIDFQISPAHLKHSGVSLFDHDNYYLRPYLDTEDSVCWLGTDQWSEEMIERYPHFKGWIEYSEGLLSDDNPNNDMTPEQARDFFIWTHRAEGAEELIPEGYEGVYKEGHYGDKPDWNVDASFGGPVPLLNKYLGNLSFLVSHKSNWEMFALPLSREYYKEKNTQLKLTSRLTKSMKLSLEGIYGEINSVVQETGGGYGWDIDVENYLTSGTDIYNQPLVTDDAHAYRAGSNIYWVDAHAPFDVYRSMLGISFDHSLSPSTFYNMRITYLKFKNWCPDAGYLRDTSVVRYFGTMPVDETPHGYWSEAGPFYSNGVQTFLDGQTYNGGAGGPRDWSVVKTLNVKLDLTSQINKVNQVKCGFIFNYDDIHSHTGFQQPGDIGNNWDSDWKQYPMRAGAYIQDKIEFEGLIANVGLRLDWNDPNTDWYTADRYSKYLSLYYKDVFTELAPTEPAEGNLKLSPRLGISHPISEFAKLFFNYGHFYSVPRTDVMYKIRNRERGINFVGNPSADMPRTIAYELGFEYNIANMFLVHLAGYYKDIDNETGGVWYTNYDGSVNYETIESNFYEDIRGFELRIEKRFGAWIYGWLNYDYKVTTSGYVGREHYYEDPRQQRVYGLQNPYQETPLARPVAHVNVTLAIPEDWGPTIAGIKPLSEFQISTLYTWKSGRYQTWDPLETYKLKDNLQWKARWTVDLRFTKPIRFNNINLALYADIENLFNTKYLHTQGFADADDEEAYLKSLHLPMYEDQIYQDAGLVPGDDKPGDIKSDDKPYINMPNREFLTFLMVRSFHFGIKFDF